MAVYTNTTELEAGSEDKAYLVLQKLTVGDIFNFESISP
jgi:hypothetical protein